MSNHENKTEDSKPKSDGCKPSALSELLDAALIKYSGNDNYKHPKSDYIHKIFGMTNVELEKECESKIWLSAYANNNPRSDYHWQCDACYDAAEGREDSEIYKRAYEAIRCSI